MSNLTFDPQPVNRTAYNCWFFRGDPQREDCVLVDVLHDGRIHVCSTRFNAHSAAHERVVYEWALTHMHTKGELEKYAAFDLVEVQV